MHLRKLRCKSENEVSKLVAGRRSITGIRCYMCDGCIAQAYAIVQGNREDRTKWVEVRAELVPEAIRLSVTDEGAGFDPHSVPEPIRPEQLDEARDRAELALRPAPEVSCRD